MIQTQLLNKYDRQFSFFFAKPVSEIVFNRTCAHSTLDFKDIIVYSESNEYLKRVYHIKNSAGRNEIYDRIRMLADFYEGAAMLKYEHPMMVISQTKDVFLKRLKRTKKMIASDCSSQESSSHGSENNSEADKSFSNSRFLNTIRSSQISQSSKNDSLINNCKKTEKSFDSEPHDIYEAGAYDLMQSKINLDHLSIRKKLNENNSKEVGLEHLIFDIDDVDREKAIGDYQKVQQRDSFPMKKQNIRSQKSGAIKKSSIIITALDHYTPEQKQSQSSEYKYYPKNSKNMKKQTKNHRYKEQYDETIRVNNNYNTNNYNSNNYNSNLVSVRDLPKNMMATKQPNNRSPSFGVPQFDEGKSTERNTFAPAQYPINYNARYEGSQQQQLRRAGRDRIYTQNVQSSHLKSSQVMGLNPSGSMMLNVPTENETAYLALESSQSSNRAKKQFIREKAVALLHKVKSEERLPLYKEQEIDKPSLYKYHSKHRLADNYQ